MGSCFFLFFLGGRGGGGEGYEKGVLNRGAWEDGRTVWGMEEKGKEIGTDGERETRLQY